MAKRRGVSGFFQGFNEGYDTVNRVVQDYELNKVGNAKAETDTGFTEDQGRQLEAASKVRDADGNPVYDISTNDQGGYVVKAAQSGLSGEIGPVKRTTFLGKTYEGDLPQSRQDELRTAAAADVVSKTNPIEGIRMRQQAAQMGLPNLQLKSAERQERTAAKQEDYEAGKADLFRQSRYAQVAEENQKYEGEMANYNKRLEEAGTDPAKLAAVGLAPKKPMAEYGVLDGLHDASLALSYDMKHGKADMGKLAEFAQRVKQVKDEGTVEALKAAQAGASKEEIAQRFNATGKIKIDPNKIVSISDDKIDLGGGAKVPTRIITYVDQNGQQRTINTARELDSLGKIDKLVERAFKGEELGIKREEVGIKRGELGVHQGMLGVAQQKADQQLELAQMKLDAAKEKAVGKDKAQEIVAKTMAQIDHNNKAGETQMTQYDDATRSQMQRVRQEALAIATQAANAGQLPDASAVWEAAVRKVKTGDLTKSGAPSASAGSPAAKGDYSSLWR